MRSICERCSLSEANSAITRRGALAPRFLIDFSIKNEKKLNLFYLDNQ